MKKSKIIKLAKKAGFVFWDNESWAPKSTNPDTDLRIDWASEYNDELIKLCDLVAASVKKKGKKRSEVTEAEFFRYVRPLDPRTGDIDSKKGTCFYVRMDYVSRSMNVSMSVCNGDNFDKTIANNMARERMDDGNYVAIDLDAFVESGKSIVEYVKFMLQDVRVNYPGYESPIMRAAANQCLE
jgi:hypothetical protein